MNQQRRSDLQETADLMEQLSEELQLWAASAEVLRENIEMLRDDEQQAYENTPSTLKETNRALISIQAIDELRSAAGNIDLAVHYLNNALQDITNILDTE